MLTVALAGKPNAGKSTFYEAATAADAGIGNYPFTTVDPNRGIAHVRTACPCLELEERCGRERCHDGKRYVPVEVLDVAGLVPRAHEGRGLGNQFLDELTTADVVLQVIDAAGATDAEGEPMEVGMYDPLEEVDFVEGELDQWLASIISRNWGSVERKSRSPDFDLDDALAELLTGFGATSTEVAAVMRELEYPSDPAAWTDADRFELAEKLRSRTLPLVVVANKTDIAPESLVNNLLEIDKPVIPATADGERALRRAVEAGMIRYDPGDDSFELVGEVSDRQASGLERIRSTMSEYGSTGVQKALNTAVYEVLSHVTVYPVENETNWTDSQGNVLPDAHLLPEGSGPRDLAYAIHSDIGDGYLHALDARTGRRIGEDYELEEGDVIKIVSTAD